MELPQDWRYCDDHLKLRASAFRCLSHHLEDHCRIVYEFCSDWTETHTDITNIEQEFQNYLRSIVWTSYLKS